MNKKYEAVVMGVSAGGLEALSAIIPQLPARFRLPVLVVQHREKNSDEFLSRYLDGKSAVCVKEAVAKESLSPGIVYIAPAGYHLLVEEDKTLEISVDPHVYYARPSVDVLFESAADVYEDKLIGVILTGANADGSQGLKKIEENGGLTIVQDPKTAESDQMPRAALGACQTDHILPLPAIGPFLRQFH